MGTRSSRLALVQARGAIDRLHALLPAVGFELVPFSSPGDRDRVTDLRESPPDFFTRDLDEAVRSGQLDAAVHSAKDLPDPMPPDIDWFWLPWREDPRDAIVLRRGLTPRDLPADPVVGISSARREAYVRQRFPDARLKPIRGNIEERLAQLDDGAYDLVIMAGAALLRLGLDGRVSEWIGADALPAPEGQGALAVTFRAGDARFRRVRRLCVSAVAFVGAGVGRAEMCTMAGARALRRADVCLHDTLMDSALLAELPAAARRIDVGKRCGQHTLEQSRISELITVYARQGCRVVRLKGGDPGLFGRLAEEIEALEALGLPYRVVPGVSSLNVATTGTGMLLTRRGVSGGFTALTARERGGGAARVDHKARAQLPLVTFMGVRLAADTARGLLAEGARPDLPCAIVFEAGGEDEAVVRGPLGAFADPDSVEGTRLAASVASAADKAGLFIAGEVTRFGYRRDLGALEGRRVLITCSDALQSRAAAAVEDAGGVPLCRPLVRMVPAAGVEDSLARLPEFDAAVVTSPSAVRCLLVQLRSLRFDVRRLPPLVVTGDGTARELEAAGLSADIRPVRDFSAEAVLACAREHLSAGARVLRLRSDQAGSGLGDALAAAGMLVTDCVLYTNEPVRYTRLPAFDAVFFASRSAVAGFLASQGAAALAGKTTLAIGQPTARALQDAGLAVDVLSPEATADAAIGALAAWCVQRGLEAS